MPDVMRHIHDGEGQVWGLSLNRSYAQACTIRFLIELNGNQVETSDSPHEVTSFGHMEFDRLAMVERFEGIRIEYTQDPNRPGTLLEAKVISKRYDPLTLARELITTGKLVANGNNFANVVKMVWTDETTVMFDFITTESDLPTRHQSKINAALVEMLAHQADKIDARLVIIPRQSHVNATLEVHTETQSESLWVWNNVYNAFWSRKQKPLEHFV